MIRSDSTARDPTRQQHMDTYVLIERGTSIIKLIRIWPVNHLKVSSRTLDYHLDHFDVLLVFYISCIYGICVALNLHTNNILGNNVVYPRSTCQEMGNHPICGRMACEGR